MVGQVRKTDKRERAARRAAREAREAKARRVQVILGYAVVGVAIVLAVTLSLTHQLPAPATIGLILLAGFRLYALRRELRRQAAEETR